jgi:hypothetical protein
MARGPNGKGRPPVADRESGPSKVDLPTDSQMVTDGGDEKQPRTRGHKLPVAFASQAAPCEGRAQYGIMYRCPICSGTHFGRSPDQLISGKRLARCGRMIWLVIARNYSSPEQGAAR